MSETFIKRIEDFVCEHCDHRMSGDGYTNHCNRCLYSKHVDIHPGDRKSTCGGLMEPIEVFKKDNGYIITHRCRKCLYEKNNRSSVKDNFDIIISL